MEKKKTTEQGPSRLQWKAWGRRRVQCERKSTRRESREYCDCSKPEMCCVALSLSLWIPAGALDCGEH